MHHGALTQYDNAHFQKRREIKKNGLLAALKANGFIYAKMGKPKSDAPFISAPPDRFPHAMMIAPTGSGKGVGFVLPNLLHFNGSAIVLDVKGENFQTTSIHRQKALGNRIWYFSPFDWREEGQGGDASTRTHRFNPLKRISKMASTEQQFTAINTMTDLFLVVDQSSNAASFFEAGRRLFVACCLYAIETNKPTIGEALKILNGGGNKKDSYRPIAGNTLNPKVSEIFLTMADQTDKILDSYISVLTGAGLSAWEDPAIDRVTSDSDFDFSTFRKEAQSLFISVQPEHLKTLAPLIRLLFADAIASLQNSEPTADEPHKVMFLMDEFDQLGRQPLVLQSIKTIRSYGGRFFIITQSIPGLESVYNEIERTALLAAAGLQIYMTPQDPKTADVLSNALGKRTIISKSRSTSQYRSLDDNPNISRRSEERPLISPSEILRFPLNEVLILPVGQFPIRASHIRYYEDTYFAPINAAREGHELPYPSLVTPQQDGPVKKRLVAPINFCVFNAHRHSMQSRSKICFKKTAPNYRSRLIKNTSLNQSVFWFS